MGNIKHKHSTSFKAKVALEIIKGQESISVICSKYSIHPTQANRWRDKALENMKIGFSKKSIAKEKQKDKLIEELYKQIGQLKVESDWLKKNMDIA